MIKFFRNIRKKLVAENSSVNRNTNPALPAGRYFKYAIGNFFSCNWYFIGLQINT